MVKGSYRIQITTYIHISKINAILAEFTEVKILTACNSNTINHKICYYRIS